MTLVVDANLLIGIVIPLPYSETASSRIYSWKQSGERLVSPLLWEYEITSALRRAITQRMLDAKQAVIALHQIMSLNIESIIPSETLHQESLLWAERLGQSRAYDAQYVALAEHAQVELWTADQRLVNRAKQVGVNWVRWVGED